MIFIDYGFHHLIHHLECIGPMKETNVTALSNTKLLMYKILCILLDVREKFKNSTSMMTSSFSRAVNNKVIASSYPIVLGVELL